MIKDLLPFQCLQHDRVCNQRLAVSDNWMSVLPMFKQRQIRALIALFLFTLGLRVLLNSS